APYLTNGRPRVVLEAQANGIPVLASNLPAVVEAVGPGGVTVEAEAPIAEWVDALNRLLEPATYDALTAAALAHAHRPEVDTEQIVTRFEDALAHLVRSDACGGDGA